MTKLLEYQGKQLLKAEGISVPLGAVAKTPREAYEAAVRIGKPVAIKAQIGVTGRFKAGGIKFATTPADADSAARELLGSEIKNTRVEKVLIEEQLQITREMYAGVIVNDSYRIKGPIMMFSTIGGVDIEQVAEERPDMVKQREINILEGFNVDSAQQLVERSNIPHELI